MINTNSPEELVRYEQKARNKGFLMIIGVDEAGRGPLAGPVVASAVCLKTFQFDHPIRDSKKLSARQREQAFHEIWEKAWVGIGIVSETVIDSVNILNATYFAMTHAVIQVMRRLKIELKDQNLDRSVCLLIDGNRFRSDLPFAFETIPGGDNLSLSIASASIVAKVYRDRIFNVYHKVFPVYGFDKHKGYPTREHREAIKKHGLAMIHRKTFHSL